MVLLFEEQLYLTTVLPLDDCVEVDFDLLSDPSGLGVTSRLPEVVGVSKLAGVVSANSNTVGVKYCEYSKHP